MSKKRFFGWKNKRKSQRFNKPNNETIEEESNETTNSFGEELNFSDSDSETTTIEKNKSNTKLIKLNAIYLEGEKEEKRFTNLRYFYFKSLGKTQTTIGTLIITNARILFIPNDPKIYKYSISNIPNIFLGNINKIMKLKPVSFNTSEKVFKGVSIQCKSFRSLNFYLTAKTNTLHRSEIIANIEKYAFFENEKFLFCYYHKTDKNYVDKYWDLYNPLKEFERMHADFNDENFPWRQTKANLLNKVIATYPEFLIIPRTATDDLMKKSSDYRTRNRVAVLSYYYEKNNSTITRGSQPKQGFSGNRSADDEKYLSAIRRATSNDKILYIFDCRPKKNAVGNRTRGGGYELIDHYDKCKLQFLGIDNIHVMRRSLMKLRELCLKTCYLKYNDWFSGLADTKWFLYLQKIIYWSNRVAHLVVRKGNSVFVHCSDGWDRTAQICSLSELIIDPYYRTIEGFEILIEKEWLHFGHQFFKRHGHGAKNSEDSQRSPIFLQWIDCVYQLLNQEPTAFEFNEAFLIYLLENLFSTQYGTFLFNNQQQRVKNVLNQNTYSLWGMIERNKKKFLNKFYIKTSNLLNPSSQIRNLSFWENYYLKDFYWKPVKSVNSIKITEYEKKKRLLQFEYQKLEKKVIKKQSSKEDLFEEIDLTMEIGSFNNTNNNKVENIDIKKSLENEYELEKEKEKEKIKEKETETETEKENQNEEGNENDIDNIEQIISELSINNNNNNNQSNGQNITIEELLLEINNIQKNMNSSISHKEN
ncbi:myotubularin-related [Anaeramoeba flamelloides]|uniref:Myotubularin-related n=1 Tax=Anaeramoeba flamelloides TaxID=1746091 RepID=A0ABQ8YT88_9EUKA|nr:myotubularin-related [Anaeramoeba flamelloides]